MSCCVVSCRVVSCRVVSCHVMSCHIISYTKTLETNLDPEGEEDLSDFTIRFFTPFVIQMKKYHLVTVQTGNGGGL